MLAKIVKVERMKDFILRVYFSDGSSGAHDFGGLTKEDGEMIKPLRDPAFFACVFLDWGALTWPNGFDLCPDALYDIMSTAGELHREAAE